MIETNDPAIWRNFLPWPGAETHKHARGRLGVVSGRAHQTGAARLAARAGLRIGAGVVRIYCPPDAVAVIAPAIEAVMLTPFASAEALAREVEEMDAVVVGPAAGLDEATVANIQALASSGAALVIDADGLSVFKGRSAELFALLTAMMFSPRTRGSSNASSRVCFTGGEWPPQPRRRSAPRPSWC